MSEKFVKNGTKNTETVIIARLAAPALCLITRLIPGLPAAATTNREPSHPLSIAKRPPLHYNRLIPTTHHK
jgi:hypothetical protein